MLLLQDPRPIWDQKFNFDDDEGLILAEIINNFKTSDLKQWEANRAETKTRQEANKKNLIKLRIEKERLDHRRLAKKKWTRERKKEEKIEGIEFHKIKKIVNFHRREEPKLNLELNIKPDSEKKINNIVFQLKNLTLCNGGTIYLDQKKYLSKNTCGIDYFLIIIFLLIKNCKYAKLENNLVSCFFKIFTYLTLNNWEEARYQWFKFCPNLGKIYQNYDWFMSENRLFVKVFYKYQTYFWETSCNNINVNCYFNMKQSKEASSFIFQLKFFIKIFI